MLTSSPLCETKVANDPDPHTCQGPARRSRPRVDGAVAAGSGGAGALVFHSRLDRPGRVADARDEAALRNRARGRVNDLGLPVQAGRDAVANAVRAGAD